jgi:hypothetical protein
VDRSPVSQLPVRSIRFRPADEDNVLERSGHDLSPLTMLRRKLRVRNWLHLHRDVLTKITAIDSSGRPPMKAFAAALIAMAILYVVDFEYNDGRFTGTIEQAVTSLVSR